MYLGNAGIIGLHSQAAGLLGDGCTGADLKIPSAQGSVQAMIARVHNFIGFNKQISKQIDYALHIDNKCIELGSCGKMIQIKV